jgi:hypothetical protein
MDISFLHNPKLSWAAKGLYVWLHSQPQGTPVQRAREVSLDEDELVSALEELSRMNMLGLDNPFFGLGGNRNVHEA